MGAKPSGPWRRVADGEAPPSLGPYEDAPHLYKYAILYQAIAKASGGAIGPDTVKLWESWEAASYLGVGLTVPDEGLPGTGRDLMAEKIAYLEAVARGEDAEPPQPDPPSAEQQAFLADFTKAGMGGVSA